MTTVTGKLVIDLARIDSSMLVCAGGKAANLGELIRAGLPVPAGFCVTTEAYQQVAGSVSIDASGDAANVRQALVSAPVPAAIELAIVDAYYQLGAKTPVAVRSSATAEDLPHASFAGQQDTFLNVVGARDVVDAVRRCWASLWTDRAVVYRATNGIDPRTVRLAVVVQQMVDVETAGVLFTANPVTGRRGQAAIDASPGLGEAVVSGAVNPDHFVVETATGEILERRLGDKQVAVLAVAGGGTRRVEGMARPRQACVTDRQITSLAALGQRVEAYFGAPQDIEWAIDRSGALWLTQSRPITTLFPLPALRPGNGTTPRVYFCFSLAQGLNRPLTPMGLAVLRVFGSAAARVMGIRVDDPRTGPPVYAEAGGRLFVDVTGTLRGRVGRKLLPGVLDVMEARSAAVLRQVSADLGLGVKAGSFFHFLRHLAGIAIQYRVPPRVARALISPGAAREQVKQMGEEMSAALSSPKAASRLERLEFVERVLQTEVIRLAPAPMPIAAAGIAMLALAGKLLGKSATQEDLQTVMRGLPYNVTTEMNLFLWQIAGRIRQDPTAARVLCEESPEKLQERFREGRLPEVAQRGVAEFLARYGVRAVAEIDAGMPRWSDEPAHIFGVLANYLRVGNPDMAPDAIFRRGVEEAEAMVTALTARARTRGRICGLLVRFALDRVRQLAGLRETPKYYIVMALGAIRRELAMIGTDLAAEGRIESAGDVFYLNLAEVRSAIVGADMRGRVPDRRETYLSELRRRHVPRVLLSDGTEPEARMASGADAAALRGTPASAGVVTGVARVVMEPTGAHLEPGEILVAPSTDPGWTPLFLTAGGLVMEMGGANSHGAVVAREYGIPAVVGVAGATLRVRSGQRISVDGGTGTVSLLEERAQ